MKVRIDDIRITDAMRPIPLCSHIEIDENGKVEDCHILLYFGKNYNVELVGRSNEIELDITTAFDLAIIGLSWESILIIVTDIEGEEASLLIDRYACFENSDMLYKLLGEEL